MTQKTFDQMADEVVEATRAWIVRSLAPMQETQRELIGRIDRQEQKISAQAKEIAALTRRIGNSP